MKIALQTRWTLLGLAIALFGIPTVATAERMLSADPQGSGMFAEGRDIRSINIGVDQDDPLRILREGRGELQR